MHPRVNAIYAFAAVFWMCAAAVQAAPVVPVDFAREVQPILASRCLDCHGTEKPKGGLQLTSGKSALKGGKSGEPVFIAGQSAKSPLFLRITSRDEDERMPPKGERLTTAQVDILKRWIDQGAVWPENLKHWAYVPPVRPKVPSLHDANAKVRNPIDAFVLARLEQEGLKPSPEAERATLIRRLSLDLIGLPPTPAEVDAFVADRDPRAYEKLVDRLLASDQFGVRWARPWLDYARYADSHGFQRDDLRDLWPYRDWVVNALNADLPFTQFTIEQLAGDLLPNATEAQKIATGFNRSAPTNVEAGTDPEETRVNQVLDRVNTLGMIWLGSTIECAQCHDHKFDPFTQKDYYGLFAYFNNTALEADRSNPKVPGSIRFLGPEMELNDAALKDQRARLQSQIAALSEQMTTMAKASAAGQAEWETVMSSHLAEAPREHVLEIADFESSGGATHEILSDKSVLLSGEPAPDKDTYVVEIKTSLTGINAFKLEALADDSLPGKGPGRGDASRPNFVLNNLTVTAAPAAGGEEKPVKFKQATASFSQANFPATNLLKTDNNPRGGWAINPRFHESHWVMLETAAPMGSAGGTVFKFRLEQNYGGGRTIGRLRLTAITGSAGKQSLPTDVVEALTVASAQRTEKQRKLLAEYRLKQDPAYAKLDKEKSRLEVQMRKVKPSTTLVMEENTPRMSTIFNRGEFRTPGEKVTPHLPVVLQPAREGKAKPSVEDAGANRLDLARWLASRDNPLVARVTVNRWWAELFGHGLVVTPEDFGIKGEAPTHPDLLDWLAVEFMDNGWSMKQTLKTMVMSATYRQSSRVTPELYARDDQNLLYARGPRHRLEAETIRDNALAIAGLLSLKQGGSPIYPYQPDGLWVKVGGQKYDFEVSPGDEKYRRGLYVVWKRGAPYPSFVNFDANARLACRVKRPRSNTPLQALTLMNDPVYVEAALAFARRIVTDKASGTPEDRMTYAFRLATGRTPGAGELATLTRLFNAEKSARAADAKNTQEFLGKSSLPAGTTADELAAWYAVATALLNLDETISKG